MASIVVICAAICVLTGHSVQLIYWCYLNFVRGMQPVAAKKLNSRSWLESDDLGLYSLFRLITADLEYIDNTLLIAVRFRLPPSGCCLVCLKYKAK